MKTHSTILPCSWLDMMYQFPVSYKFCLTSKITTITDVTATVIIGLVTLLAAAVLIIIAAITACTVTGP
jgi:hypothetical protein